MDGENHKDKEEEKEEFNIMMTQNLPLVVSVTAQVMTMMVKEEDGKEEEDGKAEEEEKLEEEGKAEEEEDMLSETEELVIDKPEEKLELILEEKEDLVLSLEDMDLELKDMDLMDLVLMPDGMKMPMVLLTTGLLSTELSNFISNLIFNIKRFFHKISVTLFNLF